MAASSARRYNRVLNIVFCLLSVLGIALSVYDVYIVWKKELDKDYVAYCDIDELFSCSKVFMTKYGKGFGLIGPYLGEDHLLNQPNGVYGALLYFILLVLSQMRGATAAKIQLGLVVLANCATPYLAYLLYKVIQAVCVVCVATYIVNAALLVVAFWRVSAVDSGSGRRRRRNDRKKSNKKD